MQPTRTRWFPWLVAAVSIALVVGAVALAGGFAPADRHARVPVVAAGEPVETRNWRFVVHRAVLTDTRPDGGELPEPVLRLELHLTNLSDHTRDRPRLGVVSLDTARGIIEQADWSAPEPRRVDLDPQVPRRVFVDFPVADKEVSVLIRTETESWSYADAVAIEAQGEPVARVQPRIEDERGVR